MRLWMNSKTIKPGDYFLVNSQNKDYVKEAIENGAVKIISELGFNYDVETIVVNDVKKFIYDFYYDEIKDLELIGITGTNGKTTTCYLIYQMLDMLGVKSCYIGTIGCYMDGRIIALNNTTPSIDVLYNILLDAKENNCKAVIMEVSSHALKQDRVYGLLFDAIGITNVTQDHMDYHKTLKDYVNSKKKIINMTRNKKICLLNKKSKHYKKFISKENVNIIIGKNVKIDLIINGLNKTILLVRDNKKRGFMIPLIGGFNAYNFLFAYYIIKGLGYDVDNLKKDFMMLKEPNGRMQKITYKNNVIFIDYAHTPDAVLKVLKTVKKIKNKGIITVIGCGGNRDKSKRPIMGKIACKYSSYVVFTNDNPRFEDEKEIMKDILKGAKGKHEVIYDRYEAIKRGINLLKDNMILMILGKGHEDYQIIGDTKYYFSDIEITNSIIDNIDG